LDRRLEGLRPADGRSAAALGRRVFIAALGFAATSPRAVVAQPASPVKIGWLTTGPHPYLDDFRRGMKDLGWIEGQNLSIEQRYAGDVLARLDELAAELVRLGPAVIVVSGAAAADAAKRIVSGLPVVAVSADPVGAGIAASLARPGSNITGIAILATDLAAKWVELATLAIPGVSRLALLADPGGAKGQIATAEAAAARIGVQTVSRRGANLAEIEDFFRSAKQERAGAAALMSSALFASLRRRIVGFAAQHRLPTVYEHRGFVEAGGLMSYGPDFHEIFRRAATYVDRILKGAKPAELPIEQPTKFELVVNRTTVAALGLVLPQSFLIRVDQVVQ
jgi:putative ABC transport system substrate-binding protein